MNESQFKIPAYRYRGFTLLELLVVISLVAILFATAIENLLPLTGEAERVALERNRVNIDTALRTTAAERLVKQGRQAVRELEDRNPIELLARPPGNYLGERPNADPAEIPPGYWYWDPADGGWLVYRVKHARYFETDLPGPPRVRFQLTREGGDQFFALSLSSPDDYHWETGGSELARWVLNQEEN